MSEPNITRWIGVGLLGLPLSGALTFWSSLHPQPDPSTHYADWARFVTTHHYVLSHVLGSGLGLILAIFGSFALGAWLVGSRSTRLGLIAMVLAVLGSSLFLMLMGVSAFAAPEEGQAYLTGIEGLADLPSSVSDTVFGVTTGLMIITTLVGNVMLGFAVWRSGVLPRWTGALWAAAPVLMYVLGLVYAVALGSQSTPATVSLGALLMVVSGGGMTWSVLRGSVALQQGSLAEAGPSVVKTR
jgi:hypothetical protein